MCGICGVITHKAEDTRPLTLLISEMTAMMQRRGPDDEGAWSDHKHCAMGFRRLSILDLSPKGNQPMLTQDGRYALVFNGELYNFRDIRDHLETKGIRFRSTGDAEVVLYALAEWGTEAFSKFNGMYALGFYDCRNKNLLIARDHAGIKPLYYLHTDEGLFFASQYDQILAHPWSKNLLVDQDALTLYLRLGYIPAPYAILERTYMLEPGAWLSFSPGGGIQKGIYYRLPDFQVPDLFGEEANEAVDSAVTNAVRRQLVSDVPVGVFLSGGIDSPLVAAKAIDHNPGMPAFTIGSSDQRFDESGDAAAYAQELGLKHFIEYINPQDAYALLDDVVTAVSEPFADYSIFPTMLVSKLASQHVKVVISGDGGDEPFWGYVRRLSSVIDRAHRFQQPLWQRVAQRSLTRYLKIGNGFRGLGEPTIGDWYFHTHSRLSEHYIHSIFPDLPLPQDFTAFQYAGWQQDQTAQWLRWNEFVTHLTMVLLKVDRASMHNSLEVRVPLLDREVLDIALRIDWISCLDIQRKEGKIPLRKALQKSVRHQSQHKRGFDVPMESWLRGSLRPVFEDQILNKPEILGLPINHRSLNQLYQRHLSGHANHARGLWTLLSLSLWEQRYYRKFRSQIDIYD